MHESISSTERSNVIARHAIVTGDVQGVGFRHYTKLEARELGLAGFVRNLSDGNVEVWAEGPKTAVEELLQWLERGPPSARVDRVSVREVEPARATRFEVRRD
jgi:acylphosphatase